MGIKALPDIVQEIMEDFLCSLSDVEVYIDDIGICSNSYDDHMCATEEVMKRLNENGCTVNPLKCDWAVQETDWLGHRLTLTEIKPWKKKVNADFKPNPYTSLSLTEMRSFLGDINCYRDI